MTQLQLSNSLGQIAEEINFYKQQAGLSLFEIGKRLKHVKDNDLAHGQWESWCESELDFSPRQARKYVRVFERFSNRNLGSEITLKKLDMLTAFDDEEIEKPVQLPTGETKAPIEMSNKELEQYKRAVAEAERRAAAAEATAQTAQSTAQHWERVAKSAQNQPPRIETKTIEIIPEHVKRDLQDKEFQITSLRAGYQEAKAKLAEYEMRKPDDFDPAEAERMREKLQHEADLNTIHLRIQFKAFIEKAAVTSFLHGAIATSSESEKERLLELVESAQQIIDQTKLALRGRRLGVVNE